MWPRIAEYEAKAAPFLFEFGLERLPREPGLLVIRGPRQYGKSTWLDLELRDTIRDFGPGSAYYLNGDEILSSQTLYERLVELDAALRPRSSELPGRAFRGSDKNPVPPASDRAACARASRARRASGPRDPHGDVLQLRAKPAGHLAVLTRRAAGAHAGRVAPTTWRCPRRFTWERSTWSWCAAIFASSTWRTSWRHCSSWRRGTDPLVETKFDGPIPDQRDFRRQEPAKDLREFFRSIEEIECVFGRIKNEPGMKGTRFRL